ncbi:MAG: ATP-binding protein [Acidobacteriota bacterium]
MLPTIDFGRIRQHQGSQHRGFEELCFQLLPDLSDLPSGARVDRHGTPDGGVEFLATLPDGSVQGWQAKYLFKLDSGELGQMDRSVRAALGSQPGLTRYTFCLPYNRPAGDVPGAKSAMERWHDHRKKWEWWAADRGMEVEFDYKGESELLAALNRPSQAGRVHYWFDVTVLTREWFRGRLAEALHHAGPRYTEKLHVDLPIAFLFESLGRTQAFQDRLRSGLRKLRESRRRHALDGLRQDNPDLETLLEAAEPQLDEVDRLVMQVDVAGTAPMNLQGVATGCIQAVARLRPLLQWIEARTRERRGADLAASVHELRQTLGALLDLVRLTGDDASRLVDNPFLLVTGEPGAGKTHLLCDVARSRVECGWPTLVLFGQHFERGPLWPQVLQQLGLPPCMPDEFLGLLSVGAETAGRRALLLIDALNEAEHPGLWQDQLAAFLARVRAFPWVGVALSCRNSYVPAVLPAELLPDRLVRVEHTGFAERTQEAVRVFFDRFHLVRPDFPLVLPELRNPLLLKLLCRGLADQGEARFPRGATAVTVLFSRFLDAVERSLSSPRRCDYAAERRLVRRCVSALAGEMLRRKREWLPFEAAQTLTEEILPRQGWSRSLLAGLLAEGVLMKDNVPDEHGVPKEAVRFAYQRLGDHARAEALCDGGIDAVAAMLSSLAAEPEGFQEHSSLIEALAIQLPERFRQELHEMVEDPLEPPFPDACLNSIVWRNPQVFPHDLDLDFLSGPGLDTLLEVACVPGHPFNALRLHTELWPLSMPERDASWTAHLLYGDEPETLARRLIDWARREDISSCGDEAAFLASTALAWFLTSSNRGLRDGATLALVRLLRERPAVLRELLAAFHGVNDPYVAERLHAVAYGCALASRNRDEVGALARQVYEHVFAAGAPPVHILLRDYARGILEWALHLGCPLPGIDIARARPPYRSPWPLRIPRSGCVEEREDGRDDPYGTIRFSVMTWDFHRYVIAPAVGQFVAPFDADEASCWIFGRVLRLGWTPGRFAELDHLLGRGPESRSRIERIGKKYQWIAFYELLAILADHCRLESRWNEESERDCSGAWELGERDLDPSLLLRSGPAEEDGAKAPWWEPDAPSFGPAFGRGILDWLRRLGDCPSPVRLLEPRDPEQKRWIVLESNPSWEEDVPLELDPSSVDRRRLWYQLRSYLVRKRDLSKFLTWARRQRWYGRWMPESHSLSEVFLVEYPWHPAAAESIRDWDLTSSDNVPVPVVVTAAEYSWSKQDASVFGPIPAVPLMRDLGLHGNGNGFEFVDEEGKIVAFSPEGGSSSCLVICPETLEAWLDRSGYALVWTLLGEKLVIGSSSHAEDPYGRAEIDGVLALRKGRIEQVSLNLHFTAPGESRRARPATRPSRRRT